MATSQETREAMVELMREMQTAGDKRKPLKGAAKWITLAILIFAFAVGVFGSFDAANFNMDDYVKFLESFAWFFGPLVISIGVGTSAKKVSDSLTERERIKNGESEEEPPQV